mmetsp:Transcript_28129/g.110629  ORF Transcript_28129/g.110629 Transcript_28129/m.110629 type:complete len:851 (-) Transcript_28129:149-2701(-)|eukprot:CAMPEP_0113962606 /NCGR_PEP_ID=MMETSP0011_2-20120614/6019_1 /TAXON_ID=101924 /ORGANISM="Rhodosorus marinus" /LENGTH=850 /DNA_ID=CAMNT_0000974499 /DNA_START=177 /DNA_END=2729 /DNA_ORIENTATION=+ /assembly_acc=CAM_ASM_000156
MATPGGLSLPFDLGVTKLGQGFDTSKRKVKGKILTTPIAEQAAFARIRDEGATGDEDQYVPKISRHTPQLGVQFSLKYADSTSELKDFLEVGGDAELEKGSFSGSIQGSFKNAKADNSDKLYVALKISVTHSIYSIDPLQCFLPADFNPNDADSGMRIGPFTDAFGDHFVQAVVVGGELTGLLEITKNSGESSEDIKGEARLDYTGSIDLSAEAQFSLAAKELTKDRRTEITVVAVGGNVLSCPEDIQTLIQLAQEFPLRVLGSSFMDQFDVPYKGNAVPTMMITLPYSATKNWISVQSPQDLLSKYVIGDAVDGFNGYDEVKNLIQLILEDYQTYRLSEEDLIKLSSIQQAVRQSQLTLLQVLSPRTNIRETVDEWKKSKMRKGADAEDDREEPDAEEPDAETEEPDVEAGAPEAEAETAEQSVESGEAGEQPAETEDENDSPMKEAEQILAIGVDRAIFAAVKMDELPSADYYSAQVSAALARAQRRFAFKEHLSDGENPDERLSLGNLELLSGEAVSLSDYSGGSLSTFDAVGLEKLLPMSTIVSTERLKAEAERKDRETRARLKSEEEEEDGKGAEETAAQDAENLGETPEGEPAGAEETPEDEAIPSAQSDIDEGATDDEQQQGEEEKFVSRLDGITDVDVLESYVSESEQAIRLEPKWKGLSPEAINETLVHCQGLMVAHVETPLTNGSWSPESGQEKSAVDSDMVTLLHIRNLVMDDGRVRQCVFLQCMADSGTSLGFVRLVWPYRGGGILVIDEMVSFDAVKYGTDSSYLFYIYAHSETSSKDSVVITLTSAESRHLIKLEDSTMFTYLSPSIGDPLQLDSKPEMVSDRNSFIIRRDRLNLD